MEFLNEAAELVHTPLTPCQVDLRKDFCCQVRVVFCSSLAHMLMDSGIPAVLMPGRENSILSLYIYTFVASSLFASWGH